MPTYDLLPGERHHFTAPGRWIVCVCTSDPSAPSDCPGEKRFDWFITFTDGDRWTIFYTDWIFNPIGAELADDLYAEDHRWRIELVGRPIQDILQDPIGVANLQQGLIDSVDNAAIPRLRRTPAHRIAQESGLLPAVEPVPIVPAMPRDPELHRVTVGEAMPALHAARLRKNDIRTLAQAEHCTREQLLDLPGIGRRTVAALEQALLDHGAVLAVRRGTTTLPARACDSRVAFQQQIAQGKTVQQIAAEIGLSPKHVRSVLLGEAQ